MSVVTITHVHDTTPEELKEVILSEIRTELQQLIQNLKPEAPAEYLNRREAAKLLKVTIVTLSDWEKKEVLRSYRLGTLVRYKRSELEAALIPINPRRK